MSVLLDRARLGERREAARGPLGGLTASLARDLEAVLTRELFIPPEKARMTRRGGRCELDGTMLEFDPFSPRRHRCPRCGATFDDESHYRWWIMGYQLWLAERSVHAATLFALAGDTRHRDFAHRVLDRFADRYLEYPNADNVLGPTRPFFSTYLESIWLLQLIVALDLLELSTPHDWHADLGARVRDRVIEPSARLIADYDEGLSNRQVWNNAALLAADRVLDRSLRDAALHGPSGLTAHLTNGLLSDGTWYEGENYHLFAHRGLWYGVTIASAAGVELHRDLIARFDEAFATPFMTALPDFTFPSRRDSQYRVSLRQWRFAELAELGLARRPNDRRLSGALATLYDGSTNRRGTGRARSTAEAERNTPATRLDRSDLGWRSLLFARPSLPRLAPATPASVLMEGQGLAILRREQGALYAALDYGHSGAGHGHPDRLNVILVRGADRWLDDVGTGSYVDPSLHWYRSTLAHNAPLVNGRSQRRVHGTLAAYEERGGAGWVRAFVDDAAPGVRLERTLVAMPTYVIDVLTWSSDRDVQIDLPFHADGTLLGAAWVPGTLTGGADIEDGFGFLRDAETTASDRGGSFSFELGSSHATADIFVDAATQAWWRATSYGPPGAEPRRFLVLRATDREGCLTTLWDFVASTRIRTLGRACARVTMHDGTIHEHTASADGWHISLVARGARSTIDLGGNVAPPAPVATEGRDDSRLPARRAHVLRNGSGSRPLTVELGEAAYRRSEVSWRDASRPTATVTIDVEADDLVISIVVAKTEVHFAPACESNPLDNEPADINSDGAQIHLVVPGSLPESVLPVELTYVLVPEPGGSDVRITARSSGPPGPAPAVSWHPTATGYAMRCSIALAALGLQPGTRFGVGVIVNDMTPSRERRRGQLVLAEPDGEFVYLRGDRLPAARHLPFMIADA